MLECIISLCTRAGALATGVSGGDLTPLFLVVNEEKVLGTDACRSLMRKNVDVVKAGRGIGDGVETGVLGVVRWPACRAFVRSLVERDLAIGELEVVGNRPSGTGLRNTKRDGNTIWP